MNALDVWKGISDSQLNILIASTFGSGDPPTMAKEFEIKFALLADKSRTTDLILECSVLVPLLILSL